MSAPLESVETTVPEEPIQELPEDPPEPQETVQEEPQVAEEPPAPPEESVVIKKRGRPPKAKAEAKAKPPPKAAPKARIKKPVTPVESSSSEEDTPINRDDMDTMLLQYLLQRKHAQRDSRRAMWVQMAGLS